MKAVSFLLMTALTLVSCSESRATPFDQLDRPFVFSFPEKGGERLVVWDWKSGRVEGSVFWEGDAAGYHPLGIASASGGFFFNRQSAQVMGRLDAHTGRLTQDHHEVSADVYPVITRDGYLLMNPRGMVTHDGKTFAPFLLYDTVNGKRDPGAWEIASPDRSMIAVNGVQVDGQDRFWIFSNGVGTVPNALHCFDPRTKELFLVYEDTPRRSDSSFRILGAAGPRMVVSRYRLGNGTGDELLIFDAESRVLESTVSVRLPADTRIDRGFESGGRFYVVASRPSETGYYHELMLLDAAAGTLTPTGMSFDFWYTEELHVRDDVLIAVHSLSLDDRIYALRYNLTDKQSTLFNIPVNL